MRRTVALAVVLALLAVACGSDAQRADTTTAGTAGVPPPTPLTDGLARCDSIEPARAPDDWYRDSPVYVANEMPIEEVQAWASGQPGFERIWIDRDRLGWISVAFSEDAELRQAELEERFPGVGVVAVPVDWSAERLERLQDLVVDELTGRVESFGVGSASNTGVVSITVGVLTAERRALLETLFAGEPVCIEGTDPEDAPVPGPQALEGDGWRLLASEQGAGESYRTGIATDEDSFLALWSSIGLGNDPPPVDFEVEVVIWFGAVFGSSCPGLRLDGVVVDVGAALVHGDIVLPDPPAACTGDANPHAFLVAVERQLLPVGPFVIQLDADGPPGGAPEERTHVNVDLTVPGAVAGPDDLGSGAAAPGPQAMVSGGVLEPGFPQQYRLYAHCGVEWLGEVNDVVWRAETPGGTIPPEWEPALDGETIVLSIILEIEPEPTITATVNGYSMVYLPSTDHVPGCD